MALPAKHGLHASISRHKARLTSELTKSRLRRKCASLEALREYVNSGACVAQVDGYVHPRWIRINVLRTTPRKELDTTFAGYTRVEDLTRITSSAESSNSKLLYIDANVPDLVAVRGDEDFSGHAAYREGRIIFQEKASCFPAQLLAPASIEGDVIDACAAPGNKTTHLAAVLHQPGESTRDSRDRQIHACEKDAVRSETLKKMTKLAGASDIVQIKAKQDFMKLDPNAPEFAGVQGLVLDPSCSGSGIVGRDEAKVTIYLSSRDTSKQQKQPRSKKRKRAQQPAEIKVDGQSTGDAATEEEQAPLPTEAEDASKLAARLANLSSFQLRLVQHAMSFPSARRITYSTCSLHKEENEYVVARALLSDIATDGGWKILRREEQVAGMRLWGLRGSREAVGEIEGSGQLNIQEIADGCIRCEKGGDGGTMGFFVAGFVRDEIDNAASESRMQSAAEASTNGNAQSSFDTDEEWEGFSGSDG